MGNPVPQPDTISLACSRIAVSKLPVGLIPNRFFEGLERNQEIALCCRHPENHDIEAFKSKPSEVAPDIYIFHCTCGKKHRRFMLGQGDVRPHWEVR